MMTVIDEEIIIVVVRDFVSDDKLMKGPAFSDDSLQILMLSSSLYQLLSTPSLHLARNRCGFSHLFQSTSLRYHLRPSRLTKCPAHLRFKFDP